MQGKKFLLTDEAKAYIVEASKRGMLEKDIAKGLNLTPHYFSNYTKKEFPEIDELIDQGRFEGREILTSMSWEIVRDPKDPARNQELQRLNRKLKTEEPENKTDDGQSGFAGLEFVLVKKPTVE